MAPKKVVNVVEDKAEEKVIKAVPAEPKKAVACWDHWWCCCFQAIGRHMARSAMLKEMEPLLKEARRLFEMLDIDGDGKLTVSELLVLRSDASFGSKEELLALMDSNKDGVVSLDEFLEYIRIEYEKNPAVARKLLATFEKLVTDERARKAKEAYMAEWDLKEEAERVFNLLDEDGSRLLDINELKALKHTHSELENLRADKSGVLDLYEFLLYVKNWHDQNPAMAAQLLTIFEFQHSNKGKRVQSRKQLNGMSMYT